MAWLPESELSSPPLFFMRVMPSRRKPIIWSFSRRSARRWLKVRARTPISSFVFTATAPENEPSRARSTMSTSVRTGPVICRDAK